MHFFLMSASTFCTTMPQCTGPYLAFSFFGGGGVFFMLTCLHLKPHPIIHHSSDKIKHSISIGSCWKINHGKIIKLIKKSSAGCKEHAVTARRKRRSVTFSCCQRHPVKTNGSTGCLSCQTGFSFSHFLANSRRFMCSQWD